MTHDDAVKRWVANTSGLAVERISQVSFDVEAASDDSTLVPHTRLEIDVHMIDGVQHLFTRRACDFGRIVDEVLALAS